MQIMTLSDVEKLERDVVENRFKFVCTPLEFCNRYGQLTEKTLGEFGHRVNNAAVLCRDGMVRPR